ncbi:MAG: DUF3158 family protein [Betaproteobacteria bacterium]|nr:DUF3158 family protein [Betaproteobacteria bacterium]
MSDQNPYKSLDHGASLKGFLKPFKGKGDHDLLQQQATAIKLALRGLMQDVLARANRPPYSLLDLNMWEQRPPRSQSETWHLRWRNKAATVVGVHTWIAAVQDSRTPPQLLPGLLELEKERITLNAQMSIVQHMLRQARECAQKFEDADQAVAAISQRKESHEHYFCG